MIYSTVRDLPYGPAMILFLSIVVGWIVYENYERRQTFERPFFKKKLPNKDRLPAAMIVMFILLGLIIFLEGENFIGGLLTTLIFISVYYLLLLMILPLLRKWMHARVIALLWIFPYSLLYVVRLAHIDSVTQPLLFITLSRKLMYTLLVIEIIGFLVVITWKLMEHLSFRKQVLQDVTKISDTHILNIWEKEVHRTNYDIKIDNLVYSSYVSTPLSIGMFKDTTYVVLPRKNYTEEELLLIFRHELTHIIKRDVVTKFFITFCTALCWFNPFMWISLNKCMEDLELSCDEEILLEADENTRNLYAKLILNTVGDSRGFSSCLSANANALRYRLSTIVQKRERRSGAFLIALITCFICVSRGQISFALSDDNVNGQIIKTATTGAEIIYDNVDISMYKLDGVYESTFFEIDFECLDEKAFHTYLSGLKLERVLFATDEFNSEEDVYSYRIRRDKKVINVAIVNDLLRLGEGYTNDEVRYYRITDTADLDYLNKIVRITPTLTISAKVLGGLYRMYDTRLLSYVLVENNQETVLEELNEAPFGSVGVFEHATDEIQLDFSSNKIIDYYIEVISTDDSEHYTITKEEIKDNTFTPNDKSSNYKVFVTYDGPDDSIYKAIYQFDISSR